MKYECQLRIVDKNLNKIDPKSAISNPIEFTQSLYRVYLKPTIPLGRLYFPCSIK
jgi:hypothetical protein